MGLRIPDTENSGNANAEHANAKHANAEHPKQNVERFGLKLDPRDA